MIINNSTAAQAWELVKDYYPEYPTCAKIDFLNSLSERPEVAQDTLHVDFIKLADYKVALLSVYLKTIESYISKTGVPFVTATGFVLYFGASMIPEEVKQGISIYFLSHGNRFQPLLNSDNLTENEMFFIDAYISASECAFSNIVNQAR